MIASFRVSELQLLLGKMFFVVFCKKNLSNSDMVKSSTFQDFLSKFLKVAAVFWKVFAGFVSKFEIENSVCIKILSNSNGVKLSIKMDKYTFL